jgi:galactose mutarotase-like enzyme
MSIVTSFSNAFHFIGATMHMRFSRLIAIAAAMSFTGFSSAQSIAPSVKDEPTSISPQFGGKPAITLTRAKTGDGNKPEFLSAVVLPGRAMNLFQITAWVPGKGEIPLLHSPSLEEAAKILALPVEPYSTKSFTFGGAFLAPFANRIVGPLSNNGKTVSFEWNGHPMTLDANWKGKKPEAVPHAIHGLILEAKAEGVKQTHKGNTTTVTGVVHGGDFGGHWFSKTDLTISVALSSDAVYATIEAKNVGDKPEPMGIGWHPYFNLPSGDRTQARLYIPGDLRAEVNNYDDVFTTGKLLPVKGTPYDFTAPGGAALNNLYLDDNWVDLKKAADGSSYTEIIDPAAKYGIRITALSRHVNTIQVYAPVDKSFVALEPQFNYNDAFGKEWGSRDRGMVTIQPGESVTWKVKLELFVP